MQLGTRGQDHTNQMVTRAITGHNNIKPSRHTLAFLALEICLHHDMQRVQDMYNDAIACITTAYQHQSPHPPFSTPPRHICICPTHSPIVPKKHRNSPPPPQHTTAQERRHTTTPTHPICTQNLHNLYLPDYSAAKPHNGGGH